ncbi:hypothetical protein B4U79_10363 [Dinothrombium tinctorium]|uniref:Uncharacterized protein n=1 Tax=Dinothrombium tinctorium TaxID=1965070 RepID=A0A443QIU6_9ACAR|nr:hypothetical protein B4U79_10363 [Dinothrombium tinctorium]
MIGNTGDSEEQTQDEGIRLTTADIKDILTSSNTATRISTFSGLPNQDLLRWIQEFEYAASSNGWTEKTKIARFPFYLDGTARDWFEFYVKDKNLKWNEVIVSLKSMFLPDDYYDFLKTQMLQRFQRNGEPTTQYVCSKQTLCRRLDPVKMCQVKVPDAPARRMEREFNRDSRTSNGRPRCFICKRVGHLPRSCFFNRRQNQRENINFQNEQPEQRRPRPGTIFYDSGSNRMTPQRNGNNSDRTRNTSISPRQSPSRRNFKTSPKQVKFQDENNPEGIFNALADTGAAISVMTVNNIELNICGETQIEIGFLNKEHTWRSLPLKVILTPSTSFQLILWQDFLEAAGAIINCREHSVSFQDPILVNCTKVHSAEKVVIPRRSRTFIRVSVDNKSNADSMIGLITTKTQTYNRMGLILANSVVKLKDGSTSVEVLNSQPFDKEIQPGTILGDFEHLNELDIIEFDKKEFGSEDEVNDSQTSLETNTSINTIETSNKGVKSEEYPVKEGAVNINSKLSKLQKERLTKFIDKYIDVFATRDIPVGKAKASKFKIITGGQPIHRKPYRYSLQQREKINKQRMGISDSTSEKDGSIRICVDLRWVNKVNKSDVYPLPYIEDALSAFEDAIYFTSLDCQDGYFLLELDEKSKEKTAFITQDGKYQYKVSSIRSQKCTSLLPKIYGFGLFWP